MLNGTENLCACWLRADQVDLVRGVAQQVGLEVVTAGGPEGPSIALALDAQPIDDLRAMLASTTAGIVLIADAEGLMVGEDTSGLSAVVEAAERGVQILTFEPIPAAALQLSSPAWRTAHDAVRERVSFVPLARRSSAFAGASEILEQFGPIEAVGIRALCNPVLGSLGARLFGACETLITLLGTPETIEAAHVSDEPTPDTLSGLTGHMTANVRFAGGRCASLFVSDSSSGWSRSITLIGQGGLIDANDHRIRWTRPDGTVVDEAEMSDSHDHDNIEISLIADSIVASLTPAFRQAPIDLNATLAMAQAAVLSSRTGHPESPGTILDMLSRS